jgi:hypothetical protein
VFDSTVSGNTSKTHGGVGGIQATSGFYAYYSTIAFNTGIGVQMLDDPANRKQVAILKGMVLSNSVKYGSSPPTPAVDFYSSGAVAVSGNRNIIQKYQSKNPPQFSNTITGVDTLLGPLRDNGGATLTHMPKSGSPAFGVAFKAKDHRDGFDQRGFPKSPLFSDAGAVNDTLFLSDFELVPTD